MSVGDAREADLPQPVVAKITDDAAVDRPDPPTSPAVEEILSDLDLYQIQGQQRLDAFCRFLRTLGNARQKDVLLYSKGDNTYPPFLAGPW